MATPKTKPKTKQPSITEFIKGIEHDTRRADSTALVKIMRAATGKAPKLWGSNLVGFGKYHYAYDSGHEGDAPLVGFSPRKASMVVYIMPGFGAYPKLMATLGKHKTGKSCLYINKLADVDVDVLAELIGLSVKHMREKYGVKPARPRTTVKAELKTKKTNASVTDFIKSIEDDHKRKDCRTIMKIMRSATGSPPKLWGANIVGYGNYHYVYDSGREGDWFIAGFSPRKRNLTLYIMPGFSAYDGLLAKLGKHKTGKSCLYINTLADVDVGVLGQLVEASVKQMRAKHG